MQQPPKPPHPPKQLQDNTHEPVPVYNPYPPRAPKVPKPRPAWFLIAVACALIVMGGLLVSTYFIQDQIEIQATKVLKRSLPQVAALGEIQFSKLKFSLFRQRLTLFDVSVKLKNSGETLRIGSFSVGGLDWESLKQMALTRKPVVPQTLYVQIDDALIPSHLAGAQAQDFLKTLGYDSLNLSSYIQIARNVQTKTFSLEHLEVSAEELGQVELSFSIGNLTLPSPQQLAVLKKDPKRFVAESTELTKLTLNGFEFTFKDDSLVKRATKAFIAMGETAPIDLVELAIRANTPTPFADRDVASTRAQVDFVLPALETLKAFLKRPSSITVASRPRKAIPVFSILDDKAGGGSINELAHRLSIVVE